MFKTKIYRSKNLFRSSGTFSNFPLSNEPRQRHSSYSAFQSQSSLNMNNQGLLHKPTPLMLPPQQHQQLQPPRPMSCMSSLNHTNEFSSLHTDQANHQNQSANTKGDKFAERLNAMLQYDQNIQDDTIAGCLSKSSSLANFQQMLQAGTINKSASQRSLNAHFQNSSNNNNNSVASNESLFNQMSQYSQSNPLSTNFNSQIQELSNKNMQAQQKLKLLQMEQQQINHMNNKPQHQQSHYNAQVNHNSDDSQKQKIQRDALDKLKKEQLQLKEQINSLNKQRESAQSELEVLATSSTSSFRNTEAQNTIMKHLSQLNDNALSLEHEINDNTPSLSPIQLENNFQRLVN